MYENLNKTKTTTENPGTNLPTAAAVDAGLQTAGVTGCIFRFDDGIALSIYDANLSEQDNARLARAVELESARRLKRGVSDLGRVLNTEQAVRP